jgi:hypothetical protein
MAGVVVLWFRLVRCGGCSIWAGKEGKRHTAGESFGLGLGLVPSLQPTLTPTPFFRSRTSQRCSAGVGRHAGGRRTGSGITGACVSGFVRLLLRAPARSAGTIASPLPDAVPNPNCRRSAPYVVGSRRDHVPLRDLASSPIGSAMDFCRFQLPVCLVARFHFHLPHRCARMLNSRI